MSTNRLCNEAVRGDPDLLFVLAYATWVNMQYGNLEACSVVLNAKNCAINNSPSAIYAPDRYASIENQET